MTTVFSKQIITESSDPDRTVETLATELAAQIVNEYYAQNPEKRPNENHDRIILTAAVVIDD